MKSTDVDQFLKSGEYLPKVMRDFHAQKELFKSIDETIILNPENTVKRPSWVEAHCYVVDVFLWYMARHGYTLQRTRRKGNFRDLQSDVESKTNERQKMSCDILRSVIDKNGRLRT